MTPGEADAQPQPILSGDDGNRYARHLTLPGMGEEGQLRLRDASVLLIGAGGLGAPAALYLAAAGVGHITVIDDDHVDLSNLQRQVLFGTSDVGTEKASAAAARLRDLNPAIRIDTVQERLTQDNALDLLRGADLVIDGTDNFPTRYLVNDACEILGKPYVYGSVYQYEGQISVFNHDGGPTYRDLYPEPPPPGSVPSCAEGGVLGVLPGVIGMLQATEAIKLLTGIGDVLSGRLLLYDALEMRFEEIQVPKRPDRPPVERLIDYERFCAGPGGGTVFPEISVQELAQRREAEPDLVILDVREPYEVQAAHLGPTHHIPLAQVPSRLAELPQDKPVVVVCRVGGRSAQAVYFLRQNGVDAINLRGGMDAWLRSGLPGRQG